MKSKFDAKFNYIVFYWCCLVYSCVCLFDFDQFWMSIHSCRFCNIASENAIELILLSFQSQSDANYIQFILLQVWSWLTFYDYTDCYAIKIEFAIFSLVRVRVGTTNYLSLFSYFTMHFFRIVPLYNVHAILMWSLNYSLSVAYTHTLSFMRSLVRIAFRIPSLSDSNTFILANYPLFVHSHIHYSTHRLDK